MLLKVKSGSDDMNEGPCISDMKNTVKWLEKHERHHHNATCFSSLGFNNRSSRKANTLVAMCAQLQLHLEL